MHMPDCPLTVNICLSITPSVLLLSSSDNIKCYQPMLTQSINVTFSSDTMTGEMGGSGTNSARSTSSKLLCLLGSIFSGIGGSFFFFLSFFFPPKGGGNRNSLYAHDLLRPVSRDSCNGIPQ